MAAGDLKRLSALIAYADASSEAGASSGFRAAALARLNADIAFDRAIWADASIGGEMTLRAPELFNIAPSARAEFEQAAFADPRLGEVLRSAGVAHAYSVRPDDPADYREMTAKIDVRHFISIADFDSDVGVASGLVLFRGSRQSAFHPDDREFAEAAFPHLAAAWTRCQVNELLRQTRADPGLATSTAITDGLRLVAAEADFITLMKREWRHWRGPGLPPEMIDRETGAACARYDGVEITVRCRAGIDRSILMARAPSPVDALTRRERAVARLCADGQTYREIAAQLGLAPTTARNHIAAVHRRLGVSRNSEIGRMLAAAGDD